MRRERKAFIVYVNLDPTPGTFHTEESVLVNLMGILDNTIPHYEPEVLVAPPHMQMPTGPEVTKA